MSPEHIGKKYIDQAAYSIGNTILKLLGYLTEEDGGKGNGGSLGYPGGRHPRTSHPPEPRAHAAPSGYPGVRTGTD